MNILSIKSDINDCDLINHGYGEFVCYRVDSEMTKISLDHSLYDQCYQLFRQASLVSAENKIHEFLDRELTQIDPAIKISFIPRTLYELFYIESCVKETFRLKSICKNINPHKDDLTDSDSKCWHRNCFRDFGDDQDKKIISLSYRLNNRIMRKLKTTKSGTLSYDLIIALANEKLAFLASCYAGSKSDLSQQLESCLGKSDYIGISANMCIDYDWQACKPLGISSERVKKLALNAIALECSSLAKGKFILYRGARFDKDFPIVYEDSGQIKYIHSLSYGSGLFAGGMYDPGATVFHYLQNQDNHAFAVLVPKAEAASSPFAIPTTHPLCQIFGKGEEFHARSRAPIINITGETWVGCINGPKKLLKEIPERFLLAIDPQQFENKFQYYMQNCVVKLTEN